jgi:AraC-like DNA-binding protein
MVQMKEPAADRFRAVELLTPELNVSDSYVCELDHTFPPECSQDNDMVFVRSGQGNMAVAGEDVPMRGGDILLIPPGRPIRLTSGREGPLSFVYVHFDSRPLRYAKPAARDTGHPSPDMGLDLPVRTPGPAPARIAECFEQIAACRYLKNRTVFTLRARALILEVLLYLHERALPAPAEGEVTRWDCDHIHRAVDRMRRSMGEQLKLKDIARTAGLSPTYFAKLFRRVVGEPPMAYLMRLRVETARDLLRDTTLPVKQIASRTGFRSIHYFSRAFRRGMGQSPRQFRKAVVKS